MTDQLALASRATLVRVFPRSADGGNPAPIVLNADDLTAEQMRRIAEHFGHESGFVLRPSEGSTEDFRFRFFVPRHEMEMCGHATLGALWLLRRSGVIGAGRYGIATLSGVVRAELASDGAIKVSQPAGTVSPLPRAATELVLDVLGLEAFALAEPVMFNSKTSRTKTLIAMKARDELHGLTPDWARIENVCERIESTGLYPFAPGAAPEVFHARQFPRSSGYPEDAATGIAATALAYGLLRLGAATPSTLLRIQQGEAMGRPSEMLVRFDQAGPEKGCWLSGECFADA